MIYYSLFVRTSLDDELFSSDYLNFDRVEFNDCLFIIKNLYYLYPSRVIDIELKQFAFNENIDELSIQLNSFRVTFYGNNLIYDPIFTLKKD